MIKVLNVSVEWKLLNGSLSQGEPGPVGDMGPAGLEGFRVRKLLRICSICLILGFSKRL